MVDPQWLWKENRALGRRLRCAKLKQRAVIADVNYQHLRQLDLRLLRTLAGNEWVRQKLNLVFTGSHGYRQKLAGVCLGAESMPGGILDSA